MIFISYIDKTRHCVACGKEFTTEDDIVVCPVCGAPHHRSCWQEEGHCHYEVAHGTDLQWHPKEEPSESTAASAETEQEPSSTYTIPRPMVVVQCPHCGKPNQGKNEPSFCKHCGGEIPAVPVNPNASLFGNPFGSAQPADPQEPIDTANVGKLSRIVLHRRDYYIPRFKKLKSQGTQTVSWNWSAFFLTTYWFAYRKCYLWAIFSSLIELITLVMVSPMSMQIANFLANQEVSSYYQAMQLLVANVNFSQSVLLLAQGALLILLLRSVIFGLFGNLIYKKQCLKRAEKLDALSKDEASRMVFKVSGVSVFAPLLFYYLIGILETLITSLI